MIKVKNGKRHLWDFESVLKRFDFLVHFQLIKLSYFILITFSKKFLKNKKAQKIIFLSKRTLKI